MLSARMGAVRCSVPRPSHQDNWFLAVASEIIEPAREDSDGGGFEVDELEAHADFGFDDANHGEGLDALALAGQGDAGAGADREGLAGAEEAAAERKIGSDAFGAGAGFEIEDFGVGGKRITDGVAAVAQTGFARGIISGSVVHGDNVAHCRLDRGIASQDEAEDRSPLCTKGARRNKKWGVSEVQESERGNRDAVGAVAR